MARDAAHENRVRRQRGQGVGGESTKGDHPNPAVHPLSRTHMRAHTQRRASRRLHATMPHTQPPSQACGPPRPSTPPPPPSATTSTHRHRDACLHACTRSALPYRHVRQGRGVLLDVVIVGDVDGVGRVAAATVALRLDRRVHRQPGVDARQPAPQGRGRPAEGGRDGGGGRGRDGGSAAHRARRVGSGRAVVVGGCACVRESTGGGEGSDG